jgi:hypothetical protein
MRLLEEDEEYLRSKGYEWEVREEGGSGWLTIRAYALAFGRFDREIADLLIRIPPGYNMAKLDMFYVSPALRLRDTNTYPPAADCFEDHCGQNWQRFSRHLDEVNGATWTPGVDNIRSFMVLVSRDLR